jgi:hypothetical protein
MEITWRTADPDGLVAFLRPFRFTNGRIVVEPGSSDDLAVTDLADTPLDRGAPFAILAVGVGTVDTERHAADAGWRLTLAPADHLLGASAAAVVGQPVVLLEPNTEGRLAASLARLGEGPVALYARSVLPQAELGLRGVRASTAGGGPFGPQRLVLGRPAWGPHLLLVDEAATIPE